MENQNIILNGQEKDIVLSFVEKSNPLIQPDAVSVDASLQLRFLLCFALSLQHQTSRNRREFMKNSFHPPSTDSLRICQMGEEISFYPICTA